MDLTTVSADNVDPVRLSFHMRCDIIIGSSFSIFRINSDKHYVCTPVCPPLSLQARRKLWTKPWYWYSIDRLSKLFVGVASCRKEKHHTKHSAHRNSIFFYFTTRSARFYFYVRCVCSSMNLRFPRTPATSFDRLSVHSAFYCFSEMVRSSLENPSCRTGLKSTHKRNCLENKKKKQIPMNKIFASRCIATSFTWNWTA